MVRDTLGEDAVIVATREEKGGKAVRVTAAVDRADPYDDYFDHRDSAVAGQHEDAQDWRFAEDDEDDDSAVAEKLTDALLRHSVPEDITDQIISCATVIGVNDAGEAFTAALEHLFSFRSLPQKASGKAFMLVGPPGAGKTLATAKLATRAVMNGQRTAVISTDTIRAGGIEQLAAFTKLLRINLLKAADADELRTRLEQVKGADQIFIDTGGINPFDPHEMRELARMIAAGNIEPVLVMPAGCDADESGEIARVYGALGVQYMMPTRLDIARRLGGLLSAAHFGHMIFADASNTAKVADGLTGLSPRRLCHLLMPEAGRGTKGETNTKRQKQKVRAG